MNTVDNKEEQAVNSAPTTVEPEREYVSPVVDIFETQEGYVLEAELPGVNKDGLTVTLERNVLTIEGRRQGQTAPAGTALHRESRRSDFLRSFQLDPEIAAEKISAKIEQGILTVMFPKAAVEQPRKITVT